MRRTSIQGGNLEGALLSQAMRNKKRAYYCQLLFSIRKIVLEAPATFLPWRFTQRLVSLSWSSSLVEPSPEEHTPLEESLESFASSRTRALSFISSLSESKILWSSLFCGATLTASVRSLRAGSSLPAAWKALALAWKIRLDLFQKVSIAGSITLQYLAWKASGQAGARVRASLARRAASSCSCCFLLHLQRLRINNVI